MKIHHIGYLVKGIEKAVAHFEGLGYQVTIPQVYDESRDTDFAFVARDGYCLELVAPRKTSELYSMIRKFKNMMYHICYEVEDMEAGIRELQTQGYTLFLDTCPAPAISPAARVTFLMGPFGMVELVQLEA